VFKREKLERVGDGGLTRVCKEIKMINKREGRKGIR
jgi:hypothetical protein